LLRDQLQIACRKRGFAAGAAAALILVSLAAARVLLSTDKDKVSLAGARFGRACFFRSRTGLPCPTCGMTRSIVLTLHGQLTQALHINPAGPLWVLTALTISVGLLYIAWRPGERTARFVRGLGLAQGLAILAVLSAHWVYALAAH
jgi:hypothetical protein